MLDNREKYQAERRYRRLTNDDKQVQDLPVMHSKYKEDNDRTYDIMDVLTKAKEKKDRMIKREYLVRLVMMF